MGNVKLGDSIYSQKACQSLEDLIIEVGDNQDLARASTSKHFLNAEEDSVLNPHVLTLTFYRQLCIAICVQELRSATKIPRSPFSSSHPITIHFLIISSTCSLQCGFSTPVLPPPHPPLCTRDKKAIPSGLDPQKLLKIRL